MSKARRMPMHHNVRVEDHGRTYRVCFYGGTREGAQEHGRPLIVALRSTKPTGGRERLLNPESRRAKALIAAARKAP